jgi:7-cyano-7-deazaguanine tRNA-ribosyltransferase
MNFFLEDVKKVSNMNFEIIDVDAMGRLGKIIVNNKKMLTPNLFPVVHPLQNSVPIYDLKKIGAECLFTNSYILYQNEVIKEQVLKSGIHKHLNFNGIIATDSGAFQQYMYNRQQFKIDPEIIESFQEDIKSDFPVILDVPVQLNDDYETAKKKVELTIKRAEENIQRRTNSKSHWIGPVHGGIFADLLRKSAIKMSKLDFAIYALGGLVKLFLDYRFELSIEMLLNVKKNIIPNKPIHMFGLGLPQFFSLAIACGCDLMDSAAYILFAKEERYFTLSTGTKSLNELEEFPCHCPICSKYTPQELRELNKELKIELLAKHNLYVSFSELKTIRQAIREGNLWELVELRVRNHPHLINALRLIKKHRNLFEIYEKRYKKHGRLFTSQESLNRPLIYRFQQRIKHNYRVPKEAHYLLILPELDVKGKNSPSIINWLRNLNKTASSLRPEIHVVFNSFIYGIVPIELSDTFPMGQFESMDYDRFNCKSYCDMYNKCATLTPEYYIDQYHQEKRFLERNDMHSLKILLKSRYGSNFMDFNAIDSVIRFFRGDNQKQ